MMTGMPVRTTGLFFRSLIFIVFFGVLSACTTAELAIDMAKKYNKAQQNGADSDQASSSVVANPHYKVGNPYQIAGVWYYPERDLRYDKTGIASWYGDQFAGKLTANGEIFDPELVSAAHKTLPMPSVVRVTNLDNGKSLVVRINDRGPYVSGRIIDMSRAGARLLGFKDEGIARVRVQLLAEQSLRLEKLAKEGQFPLLSDAADVPVPATVAVSKPAVSMRAKTTRAAAEKPKSGSSAIDLLASSRGLEVLETTPVETDIWVQIGAFHSEANAKNLLQTFDELSPGEIFQISRDGRLLYRARLGPVRTVAEADQLLDRILQRGFDGAEIVVD